MKGDEGYSRNAITQMQTGWAARMSKELFSSGEAHVWSRQDSNLYSVRWRDYCASHCGSPHEAGSLITLYSVLVRALQKDRNVAVRVLRIVVTRLRSVDI